MSLEQPFIDLINASPEDDFPKLMYADWLEEGGECELAEGWRVLVQVVAHFELYLSAMQAAAIAYVRHTYDSESTRETETGYCPIDT